MARPLRIDYPGAFHHLICRGNARQEIVRNDEDRKAFIESLRISVKSYAVGLHAFVLMENHFHLLVESRRGNVSEFMRRFNISYTAQFNRRHGRTGHLYQGRFKSVLVDQGEYLSVLSRYIHLNPVKVQSKKGKHPEDQVEYLFGYEWSSLPGYVNKQKRLDFVRYENVLEEYGGDTAAGRRRYRNRVLEEMGVESKVGDAVIGGSVLGNDRFVQWVRKTFLPEGGASREQPAIREIVRDVDAEAVIEAVCAESGQGRETVLWERGSAVRDMTMELLGLYAGLKNVEIARLTDVDYSTVSVGRKRHRESLAEAREIVALVGRIGKRLYRQIKD